MAEAAAATMDEPSSDDDDGVDYGVFYQGLLMQ
jgi:hypothetical protein